MELSLESLNSFRPRTGTLEQWNAAYVRVEDYLRAHRIHNRLHQSRLIQQVLRTLLSANLVMEVNGAQAAYAPARPLNAINTWQILLAMRTVGGQAITCDCFYEDD